MGRLRTIMIAGACVAGAAAAGLLLLRGGGEDGGGVSVPTHTVSTEAFRREVPADGNLEAVDTAPISAPQEARLPLKVAWIIEDGTRVEKGDVVVRFDPDEPKDKLVDGKASTEQARMRIAKERTTAAATRRKRDREAALAELESKVAEDLTYEDSDIFSRNEIIESQIDGELSEAKVEHARSAKKIERSVSAGKLDVLGVQEKHAATIVERAEKALQQLEVTAPDSGIVLIHEDRRGRRASAGDTVWPGQKIAEVPATDKMQARVYVLEADGGALEPGLDATLWLESRPETEYRAEIERVDKIAQPRIPEVPVQYFAVVLKLDETDKKVMKIGQRVQARILLAEAEAIAVPRQAVFTEGKKSFVYRRKGDGFEKVEVELGAGTAGRVIIEKGLSDGDEIALRDPMLGGDAGVVPGRGADDEAR